jgi:hypothetical protein
MFNIYVKGRVQFSRNMILLLFIFVILRWLRQLGKKNFF